MSRATRLSPAVRERIVRMVGDEAPAHASQWAAITSVADKIGCSPETLRSWIHRHERDTGQRHGLTTDALDRVKQLEREVREQRRANEGVEGAAARRARGGAVHRRAR